MPTGGMHAAVILWPDAFGLRPAMRDMGKRLSAAGYVVLVPNPFYRVSKAPLPGLNTKEFSFQNKENMAMLQKLMGGIGAPDAAERDAAAFVAFLDAQPQVNKREEDRHAGLLHGRPAGLQDRGGGARPRRRRRLVPRRRPGHREPGRARTCSCRR